MPIKSTALAMNAFLIGIPLHISLRSEFERSASLTTHWGMVARSSALYHGSLEAVNEFRNADFALRILKREPSLTVGLVPRCSRMNPIIGPSYQRISASICG